LKTLNEFVDLVKDESGERRRNERIGALPLCHAVYGSQRTAMRCFLVDSSEFGARLLPADASKLPRQFELQLADNVTINCTVIHRTNDEIGVTFIK
jgi:hypothetical protein